jgi:uncharacterized membrane protein
MIRDRSGQPLEALVARVLKLGTYTSIALIGIGVLLMAATGTSPREAAPNLDPARLLDDLVALRPAGFLWLGVLLVLATPSARVIVALVGYLRRGEREMATIAGLILGVVAIGVVTGVVGS